MEDSLAVANFFAYKSACEGEKIDFLKVVRLSVLAYGWHLGITGQSLFQGGIQACQYGPIVLNQLKEKYNYAPSINGNQIPLERDLDCLFKGKEIKNKKIAAFLDKIWKAYSKYKAHHLAAILNLESLPWFIICRELKDEKCVVQIPDILLKKYFSTSSFPA